MERLRHFLFVRHGHNWLLLFRFAVVPMFLFAGTFFPVDQLPVWTRPLVWATPLWHGTEAARQLMLGTPHWAAVAGVDLPHDAAEAHPEREQVEDGLEEAAEQHEPAGAEGAGVALDEHPRGAGAGRHRQGPGEAGDRGQGRAHVSSRRLKHWTATTSPTAVHSSR